MVLSFLNNIYKKKKWNPKLGKDHKCCDRTSVQPDVFTNLTHIFFANTNNAFFI